MREDRHTTTPEDAAAWQWRFGPRDAADRPSDSELAEDARWDAYDRRRRDQQDAEARARGEYVPPPWMRMAGLLLGLELVQKGRPDLKPVPTRDGVLWVFAVDPADAAEAIGDRYETAPIDNGVWVKVEPIEDPWRMP